MRKLIVLLLSCLFFVANLQARDLEYEGSEVDVFINPGEPTQIEFPGTIKSGFKGSRSAVNVERKGQKLIVFGQEDISTLGEAIIVTLENGQTYSIRVKPVDAFNQRDDIVTIIDRSFTPLPEEQKLPAWVNPKYPPAPANSVAGLMREMVLVAEFGKNNIPGFRVSTQYQGEVIFNDGTMFATIDRMFLGGDLWGYVINAQNMLDANQQLNPATFRVDGTRAVMAERWELAPKALNAEQQLAARDRAKVYVVTRAK